MSTVVYNAVRLDLSRLESVEQSPVYSDDGMDYLYTRFSVSVACVFNPALNGYSSQDDAMATVRRALNSTRKRFQVSIDGNNQLLDIAGPDVAGGPFPRSVVIHKVVGTQLLHVSFRIDAHLQDCTGGGEDRRMLSNRWSVESSYDENCRCTRHISGTLVLNGTMGLQPDAAVFRAHVMPAVPFGWKRQSFTFAPSSDGLKLHYTITDAEQITVPPGSATKASGTWRQYSGNMGARSFIDVSVSLSGPKSVSKAALLQLAVTIVLSRVPSLGGVNPPAFLKNASIEEDLFDNSVTVSISVETTGAVNRGPFGPINIELLGKAIPGTETGLSSACGVLGSSLIANVVAAWKAPCNYTQSLESVGETPVSPAGTIVDDPEVTVLESSYADMVGAMQADSEPDYTSEHRDNMYRDAQMDVSYETENQVLQLPIAGSSEELVGNGGTLTESAVLIPLARPTTRKTVTYRGERNVAWPNAPTSEDVVTNGRTLRKTIKTETPQLGADGSAKVYGLATEYEVGLEDRVDETETELDAGRLPYMGSGTTRPSPTTFSLPLTDEMTSSP